MADLDKEIADLTVEVASYETELSAASTQEETQRLSDLIITRNETLNALLRKSIPQGAVITVIFCSELFYVCIYSLSL
jgi:hypothetical protein